MSENEIIQNFERYKKILLKAESRKESLERFLDKYADRIATSPAHDRNNRISARPGGFVSRSLATFSNARDLCKISAFAEKDIGIESVIVCSLLHDIGRIGDDTGDFYVPQTSSWHIERGNCYTFNPSLKRMMHPHRGLYLLQSEGVPLTQDEWIAIVSQPHMYEDGKFYNGNEVPLSALLHSAIRLSSMMDVCGPE